MTEIRTHEVSGIRLAFTDRGDRDGPVVVLIHGLTQTLCDWPEVLIQPMLEAGYRVIAPDMRDSGGSSRRENLAPPLLRIAAGLSLGIPFCGRPPYRLAEMADDLVGLLDGLAIRRAHLVGMSMGGMIAQHAAVGVPERVASLSCLMTSSGAPGLPTAHPDVTRAMLRDAVPRDIHAAIEQAFALRRRLAGRVSNADRVELHARVTRSIRHGWPPGGGAARQLGAILADRDRYRMLPAIGCPALVIHGEDDPLLPLEHGADLSRRIPGAEFVQLPGVGHEILCSTAVGLAGHITRHVAASAMTGTASRKVSI
ncbi:alpha/beta fold hydrolase [Tabrizicola sp.]|uniref:alpha/beta fold hydrolase n=1 Tax=Tabrizicola sp. TaxID=2005166 RepID=UPI003F2F0BB8